ncbi:MAG: hypothetical protein KDB22_25525 [Planctomycetales bacterium]|nr:hypothetical protein [Planctomycetales bacterium]
MESTTTVDASLASKQLPGSSQSGLFEQQESFSTLATWLAELSQQADF